MAEYFPEATFQNIIYAETDLNFKEFENCTFSDCNFSACIFLDVTFIDCTFNNCDFSEARINYVALRTVHFNDCDFSDVNFAMCDKLIFEIHFKDSRLDRAKFYTLKLCGTTFEHCSIVAADFMKANLAEVVFDYCDLHRSVFAETNLSKTDFTTAVNYTFDPSKNKVKKALFSKPEVKGLLAHCDIIVV